MSCDCEIKNPIDDWNNRTDVPQYGGAYIHTSLEDLIPGLNDRRTVAVWAIVEFVGEPPKVHGGGVYRVVHCIGFDHLIDRMFAIGYNKIVEKKRSDVG